MKRILLLAVIILISNFISCVKRKDQKAVHSVKSDFTIAFGSCNNQHKKNVLWKEILKNKPDLWIWGGDNIYADTENMTKMKEAYNLQKNQPDYATFTKQIPVIGTWDDHDYGLNDGGLAYSKKKESQQLFLDFFDVPKNSPRRFQEGVYHSKVFKTNKGSLKVVILDTRYFRSALTKSEKKRYQPNKYGEGTLLGEKQWNWLEDELTTAKEDFIIVVSSIQFMSVEHGFETWGNFPHEINRMKSLIKKTPQRILFLSGDRHISEFSKETIEGVNYPIIDFTSSGLTHAYKAYSGEPNKYRIKNVIHEISFGLLLFNFENKSICLQMRGKENVLLQELNQVYQ